MIFFTRGLVCNVHEAWYFPSLLRQSGGPLAKESLFKAGPRPSRQPPLRKNNALVGPHKDNNAGKAITEEVQKSTSVPEPLGPPDPAPSARGRGGLINPRSRPLNPNIRAGIELRSGFHGPAPTPKCPQSLEPRCSSRRRP